MNTKGICMYKFVLLFLIFVIPLSAYDFKITVKWDEMAATGDAEAIVQYMHNGKTEAIRGNLAHNSSDNNIRVNRTLSGNSQEFIIEKASGVLINIWVVNSVMDEDFASKEDYMMLSDSKATVWVEDRLNQQTYQVRVPSHMPGLAFRGGAIADGKFYEFTEMFRTQRLFKATLIHALTGEPLADVNITIKNRATGETVGMGKTDEYGEYSQKMDYGEYDVVFTKPKFLSAKHEFRMDLTELPVCMNFALSPKIDKYRIVLTWGAFPKDLDAHLSGPKPDGGKFHIWWRNKTMIGGKNFLDIDDQNSYGPETITIYKPAKGVYKYAVHNFSGRKRRNRQDLSFSNAHVDVYGLGRLLASFDVPPGQRGNVWYVFDLDEDQNIIPRNKLYDSRKSAHVIR